MAGLIGVNPAYLACCMLLDMTAALIRKANSWQEFENLQRPLH